MLDLHRIPHSIDGTIWKTYQFSKKSKHSLIFAYIVSCFFSRGWNMIFGFVVRAKRRRCTGEITLKPPSVFVWFFVRDLTVPQNFAAASRRDFVVFKKYINPVSGGDLFLSKALILLQMFNAKNKNTIPALRGILFLKGSFESAMMHSQYIYHQLISMIPLPLVPTLPLHYLIQFRHYPKISERPVEGVTFQGDIFQRNQLMKLCNQRLPSHSCDGPCTFCVLIYQHDRLSCFGWIFGVGIRTYSYF